MGGRGSSSSGGGGGGISATRQNIRNTMSKMSAQGFSNQQILMAAQQIATGNPVQPQQPPQQPQQQQANQPTQQQSPFAVHTADSLSRLTDDQLADLYNKSKNRSMPTHLSDTYGHGVDKTQKFVFEAGVHSMPTVLDAKDFNAYLKQNNIPNSNILTRSINGGFYNSNGRQVPLSPNQVAQMVSNGAYNYIGGKNGGQLSGGGTYFDMNGGKNTGYGTGISINAVLSPNAKVISRTNLISKAQAFDKSHPKFAKATGGLNTNFNNNNMSVYALAMGYNVVSDGTYRNVIDRSALVIKAF